MRHHPRRTRSLAAATTLILITIAATGCAVPDRHSATAGRVAIASGAAGKCLADPHPSQAHRTRPALWTCSRPHSYVRTPRPAGPGATAPPPPGDIRYVALGEVPVSGLRVAATFYGACGSPSDGHYLVSNLQQGGAKCGTDSGYDDNGVGACGGPYGNLANQVTWAEDGTGNINNGVLGDLPCGTKLLITYHGHWIVAAKADISGGGCGGGSDCLVNGHLRAVDLWWQSAKALCLSSQPAVVTIHVVPASIPTTKIAPYSVSNPATTATCQ